MPAPFEMATQQQSKLCITCGRRIEWRKKWERDWPNVRYCSKRCRAGLSQVDHDLETTIVALLAQAPRGSSICPSEVAQAVVGNEAWQPLLQPARAAARRLVAQEVVDIVQHGQVVDPSAARGPFRIRKT